MKKNSLIIFAGIVIVVAGGWFGVSQFLKKAGTTTPSSGVSTTEATEAPTAVEKTPETSKVVLDETKTSSGETFKAVSGKIVSITGQVLVLEVEGDRLQVEVGADAKIVRTVLPPGSGTPQVTEIEIGQLQVGGRVDALVKVEGGKATATNLNVIVEP